MLSFEAAAAGAGPACAQLAASGCGRPSGISPIPKLRGVAVLPHRVSARIDTTPLLKDRRLGLGLLFLAVCIAIGSAVWARRARRGRLTRHRHVMRVVTATAVAGLAPLLVDRGQYVALRIAPGQSHTWMTARLELPYSLVFASQQPQSPPPTQAPPPPTTGTGTGTPT